MGRLVPVVMAIVVSAAGPPPGATNCSGCHASGINARSADELTATMLAYRSGEKSSTVMGRLMKGLSPDQIQDIAGWLSAQK